MRTISKTAKKKKWKRAYLLIQADSNKPARARSLDEISLDDFMI